VGSDEAVTIAELANLIAEQFQPRPRVEIERKQLNGLAVERYIPSIERVRREFGLHPTFGFAEAVRRTIDWVHWVANGLGEN
jgi:nucleoside-diphosphate-sugar epimerase